MLEPPVVREGDDSDIVAEYFAAHEITEALEQGKDVSDEDIAAAIEGYRSLQRLPDRRARRAVTALRSGTVTFTATRGAYDAFMGRYADRLGPITDRIRRSSTGRARA